MPGIRPQRPQQVAEVAPLGVGFGGKDVGAVVAENEFDQMLIDDANIWLETFGVEITYYPLGGIPRNIKAIVVYSPPQGLGNMPNGIAPMATITVANKSTELSSTDTGGISSSEFDGGGDKVELPLRIGKTAQVRRITELLGQDHGMIKLEVR